MAAHLSPDCNFLVFLTRESAVNDLKSAVGSGRSKRSRGSNGSKNSELIESLITEPFKRAQRLSGRNDQNLAVLLN
jgi:hypothetical protein